MATQKNNVLPRRSSLKPVEAEKIEKHVSIVIVVFFLFTIKDLHFPESKKGIDGLIVSRVSRVFPGRS